MLMTPTSRARQRAETLLHFVPNTNITLKKRRLETLLMAEADLEVCKRQKGRLDKELRVYKKEMQEMRQIAKNIKKTLVRIRYKEYKSM